MHSTIIVLENVDTKPEDYKSYFEDEILNSIHDADYVNYEGKIELESVPDFINLLSNETDTIVTADKDIVTFDCDEICNKRAQLLRDKLKSDLLKTNNELLLSVSQYMYTLESSIRILFNGSNYSLFDFILFNCDNKKSFRLVGSYDYHY